MIHPQRRRKKSRFMRSDENEHTEHLWDFLLMHSSTKFQRWVLIHYIGVCLVNILILVSFILGSKKNVKRIDFS